MKHILQIAGAILLVESAGIVGSLFMDAAWYEGLVKPVLTPPNWAFGPVWAALYALMGISLYLVWSKRTKEECHCGALSLFFFQLALNALWPALFFGLKEPLLAFITILILLAVLLLAARAFWGVSRKAAFLLFPSVLWVGFAAYLNYGIWQLN